MAKKIKTYVITMMVNFPVKAPFLRKPTGFKKKILSGEKKHTIRQNYEFWKKRIDEINAGRALLSIRQWTGKPYKSKQKEIKQFHKGEIGYQRVKVKPGADTVIINSRPKRIIAGKKLKSLADNDGITLEQMRSFFKSGVSDGIIIHFTDLRY